MAGRLIYLMGPSGSGKDTVLQRLSQRMGERAHVASRLITRPPTETERDALSVSEDEFRQIERNGGFAMSWQANGLFYGVRWSDIGERLLAESDVLVNGSREYLPEASRRFRTLVPVMLTVDEATLRHRLAARGREDDEQIRRRMQRNVRYGDLTEGLAGRAVRAFDNSGSIEHTVQALYDYLFSPEAGTSNHYAIDSPGHRQRGAGSRL